MAICRPCPIHFTLSLSVSLNSTPPRNGWALWVPSGSGAMTPMPARDLNQPRQSPPADIDAGIVGVDTVDVEFVRRFRAILLRIEGCGVEPAILHPQADPE